MSEGPTCDVDYDRIVNSTDDAILFEMDGGPQVWIPRTQIVTHDEVSQVVEIPVWLAGDRGLL